MAELSPPRPNDSGLAESDILAALGQPAATKTAADLVADLILSINGELQQASREAAPIVEFGITLNGNKAARTAAREAFDHARARGALLEQSLRHVAASGAEPNAPGSFEASAESYASAIKSAIDAASPARIVGHRGGDLLLADRLAAVTDAHATAQRLVAGATFVDTNIRAARRRSGSFRPTDSVAPNTARETTAGTRSETASPIAESARALAKYFDRSVAVTALVRREIQLNLPDLLAQAENRIALALATAGASETVGHRPDPARLLEAIPILSQCAGAAGFARDDLTVVVLEAEAAAAASLAVATRRMANAAHIAEVTLRWSEQHHENVTSAAEIIRTAGGRRDYRTTSFNTAVDKLMTMAAKSLERSTEAKLLAALTKGRVAQLLEAGAT